MKGIRILNWEYWLKCPICNHRTLIKKTEKQLGKFQLSKMLVGFRCEEKFCRYQLRPSDPVKVDVTMKYKIEKGDDKEC